jgi:hypothetical protein
VSPRTFAEMFEKIPKPYLILIRNKDKIRFEIELVYHTFA